MTANATFFLALVSAPLTWTTIAAAGPLPANPLTRDLAEPIPFIAPTADEGDDQYRLIAGLADKKMHGMVVREGEAFLRDYPRHEKRDLARYRLAAAHFELGALDRALPHLRELERVQRFEYAAEVAFRLGQCEAEAGNHAQAIAAFERVVALNKDYLVEHARFLAADTAFQAGDYAAADRGYAAVLRHHPNGEYTRDASSGHAWTAWKLDQGAEAVRRIEAHLARYAQDEDDPYAGELSILLGEARLDAGDADGALAAYRAIDDPAHAQAAMRGAGHALAARGDHAGAAREFERLLQADPRGEFAQEAALFQGVHLVQSGDARGAIRALSHRAAGNGPEVSYWRARAELEAGDTKAALATTERALRGEPGEELEGRLAMLRGDALTALGRNDEAIQAYQAAGSDYALHAASVAALNEGDPRGAIHLGEQLLRDFADSEYRERTQLVVAEAWFAEEQYSRASQGLAALAAGASTPDLRARAASRLAWCTYFEGDHAQAAQMFARITRDHGDAAEAEEAAYMHGRAAEEAGDKAGAARAWRGYISTYPRGESRAEVLAGLTRTDALDAALQAVETLSREYPEQALVPGALYDLAERASAAGSLDAATACYERLLATPRAKLGPLGAPARYGLGWCHVQSGRFLDAGKALREARQDRDAEPELRAAAAELEVWAWRSAERGKDAADAWRALAALNADGGIGEDRLYQAAKTAALALQESGDARGAQELLNELLRHTRTPLVAVEALVEGAYIALDAGDIDRAEAQVAVAKRRVPANGGGPAQAKLAEASFFVAEARFEDGALDRARELYLAGCAQGSPVRDLALYKLGYLELDAAGEGPAPAAVDALARLVGEHADSELFGEALFLLGEARYRGGDFAQAARDLERLRRERPRHAVIPKALFRLGLSYGALERWKECDATLSDLLKREPHFENLAEAELTRGRALVELGRARAARTALGRVLSLSGDSVLGARAHLALGILAEAEHDDEDALAEYLKVAVLYAADDEVAEALYRAGDVLARQGKADLAHERWREAAAHKDTEYGRRAAERLDGSPRRDD